MARDEWRGIKSGWAYKGKTYDKGMEIFFISRNKKRLDNFVKGLLKIYEMETKDSERYQFGLEMLYFAYSDIGVVYPYQEVGCIEDELLNGTIIFSLDIPLEQGKWEKEYVRVPLNKMKRFPGYVFG